MCTAASDIRGRTQGLGVASNPALCFTDISVDNSFSSNPSQQNTHYLSPQSDIGPILCQETYTPGLWQPSSSRVPTGQSTHTGSNLYPHTCTCSHSGPTSLPDTAASVPLPSSSMSMPQFYFAPAPLDDSITSQVPSSSDFISYRSDKALADATQDASLLLPHDSPGAFSSVAGPSADEALSQFSPPETSIPPGQWLSLTPATDYLTTTTSPAQLSLSSPAMSTTTTASPSPSSFPLPLPQYHSLQPTSSLNPSIPLNQSPSPTDLTTFGIQISPDTWRCAYPGCTSTAVFRRGCDLRKHFNRHRKHLFCRHEGCPQSSQGGFSSKKDRARHEAKHDPRIRCEWDGCGKVFSRVDNMKDHVRRIHRKREGK